MKLNETSSDAYEKLEALLSGCYKVKTLCG